MAADPAVDSKADETPSQPEVQTQTLHLQWLRAALICRNYEFLDSA
jgi:hypothetical protein